MNPFKWLKRLIDRFHRWWDDVVRDHDIQDTLDE